MKKGAVDSLHALFINAMDDGDRMRKCWVRLFHNYEYLTITSLALTNVFVTERVEIDSVFGRVWEWISAARCRDVAVYCNSITEDPQRI